MSRCKVEKKVCAIGRIKHHNPKEKHKLFDLLNVTGLRGSVGFDGPT
jgi:hypothetical protein